MSEYEVSMMLGAYVERTRYEAKILIGVLAEALKPQEKSMSLGELAMMGFGIEGA